MVEKGVGVLRTNKIEIEFDEETQDYYIIWKPIVISSGKTREEALEDLKVAAHYGIDTLIDLNLGDMRVRGKTRFRESLENTSTWANEKMKKRGEENEVFSLNILLPNELDLFRSNG